MPSSSGLGLHRRIAFGPAYPARPDTLKRRCAVWTMPRAASSRIASDRMTVVTRPCASAAAPVSSLVQST